MTLEEYFKKRPPSAVTLELVERLKAFSEEDDFIVGTLVESKPDEDRQRIIDYIDHGVDVSYENIILFSLELALEREKQMEDKPLS